MATVIADALGEHTFEFVAELLCDKEGVKVLTETLQVHDRLQDTYWICAFSVNQHAGICGANPDGDTDPVTKIPHPVCGCKTPIFFNKDPPLNEQGESIMCEMNKFDDMMALLAKKNPNLTEVVAVDADLNLFHILVVAMLRWMGPWQRFHKGTLKGWARAIETAIWGYSTPPGRCGYLFWTAIAGLRCHLECALSTEAIMYEWRRQVNLFLGKCTVTRASPRAIDTFNLLNWKNLQNDVWQTPLAKFVLVGFQTLL